MGPKGLIWAILALIEPIWDLLGPAPAGGGGRGEGRGRRRRRGGAGAERPIHGDARHLAGGREVLDRDEGSDEEEVDARE